MLAKAATRAKVATLAEDAMLAKAAIPAEAATRAEGATRAEAATPAEVATLAKVCYICVISGRAYLTTVFIYFKIIKFLLCIFFHFAVPLYFFLISTTPYMRSATSSAATVANTPAKNGLMYIVFLLFFYNIV